MSGRPTSERRPKITNSPSRVLTNDENESIFNILGSQCTTLCTAVVQVFLADQTSGNGRRWNKRCTGVLTFVRDNEKKSYFLRVYSLKYLTLDWEQELYNNFKYKNPRPQFHTFEAEHCSAGFNFAQHDEANAFYQTVDGKLKEKQEKRRTRRQRTQAGAHGRGQNTADNISAPSTGLLATPAPAPIAMKTGGKNKSKNKAKKLTKEDISTPSDFRHLGHIGWDPNSGFDMNDLDPDMKSLFDMAGISNDVLADETTRKAIYDVIEKQGGLDAVKKEIGGRKPPNRELPPTPDSRGGAPPPPPPHRDQPPAVPTSNRPALPSGPPPPPPSRNPKGGRSTPNVPPPPPPSRGGGGPKGALPPPPPPAGGPSYGGAPIPPPPGVPAPPPPPPPAPDMSGMGGGPPPPPAVPAGRGALLSDIHKGANLRPAGKIEGNRAPPPPASGRDALLNAIKEGKSLKHVEVDNTPSPSDSPSIGGGGGLLDALQKVMSDRNKAINPSDDSDDDDDDEDDDDEWD